MSRIILSRYETGQERFTVGWDHPAGGAFWQEFNEEPEDGDFPEDFEEVIRFGGMWPGIAIDEFYNSVPEDLQPLVTPTVIGYLIQHAADPESGLKPTLDLTKQK